MKPTSGAAVTIDSNNTVKNEGAIAIQGVNDAAGILANPNLTGDITNSGTITIDEDYTPTDADKDGDLDGPFAQGTNRFGIHVLCGGTYTGNIVNSGTITVEGNQSAGIAIDSALTGSLSTTGKINVIGNNSVGIRTARGQRQRHHRQRAARPAPSARTRSACSLGGNVGGAVVIQGTVSSTGYRSTTPPADTSKLDADDLLQGGSAVVVAGNVARGILLDAKPATSMPTRPTRTMTASPTPGKDRQPHHLWLGAGGRHRLGHAGHRASARSPDRAGTASSSRATSPAPASTTASSAPACRSAALAMPSRSPAE